MKWGSECGHILYEELYLMHKNEYCVREIHLDIFYFDFNFDLSYMFYLFQLLHFLPNGAYDELLLVQAIAWCWMCDKLLPHPMMTQFYDIRPQWVKIGYIQMYQDIWSPFSMKGSSYQFSVKFHSNLSVFCIHFPSSPHHFFSKVFFSFSTIIVVLLHSAVWHFRKLPDKPSSGWSSH